MYRALLLLVASVHSLSSAPVSTYGGWRYTVTNGAAILTAYYDDAAAKKGVKARGSVTGENTLLIPNMVNGIPVREFGIGTSNGSTCYISDRVTSIIIPDSVTNIGGYITTCNLTNITL